MKYCASAVLAAIIAFCAGRSAAQPLTGNEVAAAMKAPEVKAAFMKCVEGKTHADVVKLEILITREGVFSLASTSPQVDAGTKDCFAIVTASIKLHPVDKAYKMVYSLSLAETPAQAPAQAPLQSPGATPAAPPSMKVALNPDIMNHFKNDYKSGARMVIAGSVLCGISVVGLWLSWLPHLQRYDSSGMFALNIIMKVGFSLTTITGLILIVVGAGRMEKALRERNKMIFSHVALSPDPSFKGAVISSVWRF